MNDIQVGEYVRFFVRAEENNVYIGKITNIKEIEIMKGVSNVYYNIDLGCFVAEDEIIKHSFNIADLIEVGDYVNGYKVSEINNRRIGLECSERSWSYFYWEDNNFNIDTILTKEQFERMEYKV